MSQASDRPRATRLLRIEAPHFVAAVDLDSAGRAFHAAPILHYMLGWTEERIVAMCARKGWTVGVYLPLPYPPS